MNLEYSMADYSTLPAHIIANILRYLELDDFKNASVVCKSWYYGSTDPQIVRTLVLRITCEHFSDICNSNRRYGILKLDHIGYSGTENNDYFEFCKKFCPFVKQLKIRGLNFQSHHLLNLLEFSTSLEKFSLSKCSQLAHVPGLFPLDYVCEAKNRIVKNLSGVKSIAIESIQSIPLIADLLRYSINLDTFSNDFYRFPFLDDRSYRKYFTIFDNDNACNLKHLNLKFHFSGYVDHFIKNFVKIKKLNLCSFKIALGWTWKDKIYKSDLFRQLILKLRSLMEFTIDRLSQDQLSLICQHLVELKCLNCERLDNDQPISELANLKKLEEIRCRFSWDDNRYYIFIEIDKFFKCKFEYLRIFEFNEFVTEPNLLLFCENHPNLNELILPRLLTRNLEIIFKYLSKLRVLIIYFGFELLESDSQEVQDSLSGVILFDSDPTYEYKISRLVDLEVFYLDELVNGIHEDDVRQLKKLRSTNLPGLFGYE